MAKEDKENKSRKKEVRLLYKEANYDENACHRIIEMMSQGKTVAQFLAEYNVSYRTFYNWQDDYPEFRAAYDEALTKSEAYHDEIFDSNMFNPEFNERLFLEKTKRIFGAKQKRRTRAHYLKAKELTESLDLMIRNAENGHVDLDEMNTYTKLLGNMASVKANHELAQKVQELEMMMKEKEKDE